MERVPVDERDITPLVASNALRVDDAQAALEILWLVQCEALKPLTKPLNPVQRQSLGHGNVIVWLDHTPFWEGVKGFRDGREWMHPVLRNGLYIFRERRPSILPTLCRYHFTARRNVQGMNDDRYWHLVTYQDHAHWMRKLDTLHEDAELSRIAKLLPDDFFVVQWDEPDSPALPPPIKHNGAFPRLPPPSLATEPPSEDFSYPKLGMKTETRTAHQYFPPPSGKERFQTTDDLIEHSEPRNIPIPPQPAPKEPPEVTHLQIDYQAFQRALLEDVYFLDPIEKATNHIVEHENFQSLMHAFASPTPSPQPFVNADAKEAAEGSLKALLDTIEELGVALDPRLRASYRIALTKGRSPSMTTQLKSGGGDGWEGCAFFMNCTPRSQSPVSERDNEAGSKREAMPEETRPKEGEARCEFSPWGSPPARGASPSASQRSSENSREPTPDVELPPPRPTRDPFEPLSADELVTLNAEEMLGYAQQVLSHTGTRRHILGIDLDGSDVRIWYFDRAGSVHTHLADIASNPAPFVRLMLTLQVGTLKTFGKERLLFESTTETTVFGLGKGHSVQVGRQFFELVRPLNLSTTSPLFGRASTLYEVKPTSANIDARAYNGRPLPSSLMARFSWQRIDGPNEDELFRRAEQHNIEGVPRLYLAATSEKLSQTLRGRLSPPDSYCDRVLHMQVLGPVCVPLYIVKDLPDFKSAFRSILEAHHQLYEKAGILHRDINPLNLMVQEQSPSLGMLAALDHGGLNHQYGVPVTIPATRDGTVPFLALDLLNDKLPVGHLYRHDLESLFYSLAWLVASPPPIEYRGKSVLTQGKKRTREEFEEDEQERDEHPEHYSGTAEEGDHAGTQEPRRDTGRDHLLRWYTGSLEDMAAAKRAYIAAEDGPAPPRWQELDEQWIAPLRVAIREGYAAAENAEERKKTGAGDRWGKGKQKEDMDVDVDWQTLGGHVTYERFRAILDN
ncbi:hypothetical protein DL93DRAFT_2166381 [Clavulina sp. PMI_390]|nr:hypothetical protein DL93DRAFT_2166381 [Clavulina sp. PMI_390]